MALLSGHSPRGDGFTGCAGDGNTYMLESSAAGIAWSDSKAVHVGMGGTNAPVASSTHRV